MQRGDSTVRATEGGEGEGRSEKVAERKGFQTEGPCEGDRATERLEGA